MNDARPSTDDLVPFDQFSFGETGFFEQGSCASVEIEKVAEKIDDLRGIAIAPLDVYGLPIFRLIGLAHDLGAFGFEIRRFCLRGQLSFRHRRS
jgi:hypothetical protein